MKRTHTKEKENEIKEQEDETKEQIQKISSGKSEFKERQSILDSLNGEREKSEYRGFFNLISIAMVFFFFTTQARNVLKEGTLVGLQSTHRMFTRYDLFPSWIMICFLSFSPVVLQKIILLRILPTIVISILRIFIQFAFFGAGIIIAIDRDWPLVQMSFFLAELLVLIMKMHSYIVTNRDLDKEYTLKVQVKNENDHEEVDTEGKTKFPRIKYPNNVTFQNYLSFLLVPTCVYELEYPRTSKVRLGYFLEKLVQFIGMWAVLHVLVESYIKPVLEASPSMTQLEAISHLIIPFTVGYLMIFYLVFDVCCNGFAELTRFADREFYTDWNSNTFDEFARKWNKPVHEFLLRHVYLESINTYKMSKNNATLLTFLFSSIVHEFFMTFTLKIFRPWLFFFQMVQIPLIYISRYPPLRKNKFGNHFFWFGMILGPPLLSLLYAREYFLKSYIPPHSQ
jgi:sterol O-acyltransferase